MSQEESRIDVSTGAGLNSAAAPSDAELRAYIISHIDEAVESGWVRPYYQPVVRTLTGKLCGLEALARWDDPRYGLLAPSAFIPALEEARLIHLLDCCIINQVCRQYRQSVDEGTPTVPVSFNLSRLDFDLCDIFNVVEEAVRSNEVPRGMLNIEITESVFGTDPTYMAGMVGKFHAVGYQVWMDDFGSGYSTLNALKDFDFDELKIDMEFLNRFGEKSKTILASVVDMAKKLGIQTLAEGVETEEHRRFLHRIGCEKMQGYLFGRPEPYSKAGIENICGLIGVESTPEKHYFEKISSVNMLSLSERDLTPASLSRGYLTSMPLAIIEYHEGRFRFIDSNLVFREGLENVGVYSIEEAEARINDQHRQLARQAQHLVDTIARDKFARIDYVVGGVSCVMRAKHITSQGGRTALLVSIDDTIEQGERKRHGRMAEALYVIYSIYEHVDILHLDEGFSEPVFSNAGYRIQYEMQEFDDVTEAFADAEIYPSDRERYIDFMDHDTMVERIQSSGDRYLTSFFRTRDKGGDYVWKLFALIHLHERPGRQVMLCIRATHSMNDGVLQNIYGSHDDGDQLDPMSVNLTLSDGSLWRALTRDENICMFWKDRERRFVGANRAFLDYYHFDSLDDIIGKTDEDMGWHIDPVPYMELEMRVLNEGESVDSAPGQCIVRGEVHNIVATKRPVYRNGKIVGLVGYFTDVDQRAEGDRGLGNLPLHDPVSGVLNYTGLEAATWKFVDAYKRLGIDFAMISVNIESFQHINDVLGYEFGDKVLARVGEVLIGVVGASCAIGHVYADRFVILAQEATDEQLRSICGEIEERLTSIAEVDGTPCTVYALAGFSRYSVLQDVEAMKRSNRDRRMERRIEAGGMPNPGDVITSTLL